MPRPPGAAHSPAAGRAQSSEFILASHGEPTKIALYAALYSSITPLHSACCTQDTVIKRLNKAVLFLGVLLALSVCANFGVSFVAVELSRNTDVDEDTNAGTRKGELLVKDGDGHAVVKVSETVVDIKMLLTPALPYDMLERIKTVEYISDRTMHDVAVAGYSYVSESSFTLHLETGGKLQMDGMAVFETKPDGSGPFELPASALVGQLINESRCIDWEALTQIFYFMPAACGSRNGWAPTAATILERAEGPGGETCLTRITEGYEKFEADCSTSPRVTTSGAEGDAPWPQAGRGCLCMAACGHTRRPTLHWFCTAGTDSAMACTDHCTQLLEGIYTNLRDECRGMSDAPPLRNSATCLEAAQGCPGSASLGRCRLCGGLAWANGLRFARQVRRRVYGQNFGRTRHRARASTGRGPLWLL